MAAQEAQELPQDDTEDNKVGQPGVLQTGHQERAT
jgi:hypothetical protein